MAAKSSPPDIRLSRLTRRADFLAAARGIRKVAGALTLEMAPSPGGIPPQISKVQIARVGFTASRRVGNAVARNRAKRRMRAAARQLLAHCARPGHDYVLVARPSVLTRNFQALLGDLAEALAAAHRTLDARTGGGS